MPTIYGGAPVVLTDRPLGPVSDHIAIDCDTLEFLGRGPYRDVCTRAYVARPKAPIWCGPIDRDAGYGEFTDFQLIKLYENTTGQKFSGFGRFSLQDAVKNLALSLPVCEPLTDEIIAKADALQGFEIPPAILAPEACIPRAPKPPSSSREPRAAAAPGSRPSSGTTTGRVWDIADSVYDRDPAADMKVIRAAIIKECTDAGINPATAQVQYGKWKGAKFST